MSLPGNLEVLHDLVLLLVKEGGIAEVYWTQGNPECMVDKLSGPPSLVDKVSQNLAFIYSFLGQYKIVCPGGVSKICRPDCDNERLAPVGSIRPARVIMDLSAVHGVALDCFLKLELMHELLNFFTVFRLILRRRITFILSKYIQTFEVRLAANGPFGLNAFFLAQLVKVREAFEGAVRCSASSKIEDLFVTFTKFTSNRSDLIVELANETCQASNLFLMLLSDMSKIEFGRVLVLETYLKVLVVNEVRLGLLPKLPTLSENGLAKVLEVLDLGKMAWGKCIVLGIGTIHC